MQNEWNRLLWAIEISGIDRDDKPILIGRAWDHRNGAADRPLDELARALLFTTRAAAHAWCAAQRARRAGRLDCCADWRFRPVRVRETVRRTR